MGAYFFVSREGVEVFRLWPLSCNDLKVLYHKPTVNWLRLIEVQKHKIERPLSHW